MLATAKTTLARIILSLSLVLTALALVAAPGASASVTSLSTSLDGGSLSDFSQINALTGTFGLTSTRAYTGTSSARATYSGGGANGYARGIWNVEWVDGEDVWFGAAYYLPVGFHASIQGQVDLIRWDNWSLYPTNADWGGVSIYGSDHRARLLRFGAGRPNDTLVGPLDLPEGRWFTLEVHQRRSATSGSALSELYVDGKLVGKSTAANTYGRPATRIRYGIVAIASGSQIKPLELNVDSASMGTSSKFSAPAPAPEPAPAPAPAPEPAPAPAPEPAPAPAPEPAPSPEPTPAPAPEPAPTEEGTESKPTRGKGHKKNRLASLSRVNTTRRSRCAGQRRARSAKRSSSATRHACTQK